MDVLEAVEWLNGVVDMDMEVWKELGRVKVENGHMDSTRELLDRVERVWVGYLDMDEGRLLRRL